MTIAEAALLVGGFIAVAVGLIDIFLTVLHYEGYGFLSGWAYRRATARLARTTGAGSVGDDRASRFEAWRSFMEPVYSFAGASARDLAYDADEGIPLGNGF